MALQPLANSKTVHFVKDPLPLITVQHQDLYGTSATMLHELCPLPSQEPQSTLSVHYWPARNMWKSMKSTGFLHQILNAE